MVIFIKLFYVLMSFLVVAGNPLQTDDKTISHIGLKIGALSDTVESNTISQSQDKHYNSDKIQNDMQIKSSNDKLLESLLNLFEKAGNSLSPKPSNPQLFTMLKVLIFPKYPHTRLSTTTEKYAEVVSTKRVITTSTELSTNTEYYDDDDDSTRPIKFVDTKTFDFGKSNKVSRRMPEVEHGSVQYTT